MSSLPADVYESAKIIWENTPRMSWREVEEELKKIFKADEVPSYSSLSRRAKKEGWVQVNPVKQKKKRLQQNLQQNDAVAENENKAEVIQVDSELATKLQQAANRVVMDKHEKSEIILKHRHRVCRLGDMQEVLTENLNELRNADLMDGDEIKEILVKSDVISRVLERLVNVQANLFKQEMIVCGIEMSDFEMSEQERREQSMTMLDGIYEQELAIREQRKLEMIDRLQNFEFTNTVEDAVFTDIDDA